MDMEKILYTDEKPQTTDRNMIQSVHSFSPRELGQANFQPSLASKSLEKRESQHFDYVLEDDGSDLQSEAGDYQF